MKKIAQQKISLLLAIVLVLVSIGATWGITYALTRPGDKPSASAPGNTEPADKPETPPAKTDEERYYAAVRDSMTIEEDEILPVISLEQGAPYAIYNEEGQVLVLTFHKYPDSYPDGADVSIAWGEVWTFSPAELAAWYAENNEGVTDWPHRLRQLIGLTLDNQATHFTAMWVEPEDLCRPANVRGIGDITMTSTLAGDVDPDFKAWFDSNIIWSYYDSAYPWTRLGYTYDWSDSGSEYGLSEFLVADGSDVTVAYTVTTEEMVQMLADGSWNPEARQEAA